MRRDSALVGHGHKRPHTPCSGPKEILCISGREVNVAANGQAGLFSLQNFVLSPNDDVADSIGRFAVEEICMVAGEEGFVGRNLRARRIELMHAAWRKVRAGFKTIDRSV